MANMSHHHFVTGPGFYYPTTPPQPQPTMPHTHYTPQFEYHRFSFTEPMPEHSCERSLSEPFIFQANTPPRAEPRLSIPSNAQSYKFPAVPISPIHITPRVKAKRTPTVSNICPVVGHIDMLTRLRHVRNVGRRSKNAMGKQAPEREVCSHDRGFYLMLCSPFTVPNCFEHR